MMFTFERVKVRTFEQLCKLIDKKIVQMHSNKKKI